MPGCLEESEFIGMDEKLLKTVKENLCAYDPLSPYYDEESDRVKSPTCFCDNCFYGRARLAEIILSLIEKE